MDVSCTRLLRALLGLDGPGAINMTEEELAQVPLETAFAAPRELDFEESTHTFEVAFENIPHSTRMADILFAFMSIVEYTEFKRTEQWSLLYFFGRLAPYHHPPLYYLPQFQCNLKQALSLFQQDYPKEEYSLAHRALSEKVHGFRRAFLLHIPIDIGACFEGLEGMRFTSCKYGCRTLIEFADIFDIPIPSALLNVLPYRLFKTVQGLSAFDSSRHIYKPTPQEVCDLLWRAETAGTAVPLFFNRWRCEMTWGDDPGWFQYVLILCCQRGLLNIDTPMTADGFRVFHILASATTYAAEAARLIP